MSMIIVYLDFTRKSQNKETPEPYSLPIHTKAFPFTKNEKLLEIMTKSSITYIKVILISPNHRLLVCVMHHSYGSVFYDREASVADSQTLCNLECYTCNSIENVSTYL